MSQPIRYVEAVRHIMMLNTEAIRDLGQMKRTAEASGYSMLAFNGQIWARDDDSGGAWVKTPPTVDMMQC